MLISCGAVDAQATHAAVGEDAEAKMRRDTGVLQFLIEVMTRVGL